MTRGETYHENDIVSLVLGEELGCVVHLELHGECMDEGDCTAGIYGRMRSTRGSERRTERKGVNNVNERGVQERKAVHNASSDGGGRRERAAREAEAIISGCDGASRRGAIARKAPLTTAWTAHSNRTCAISLANRRDIFAGMQDGLN